MNYGLGELMKVFYGKATKEAFMEMAEEATSCGRCPSICVECGWTDYMEPDQDEGYCEDCQQNTVKSALILAGLI